MTIHSQTESVNKTSLTDAMETNTSTDAATMNCSFDMDTSITMEESTVNDTLQMRKAYDYVRNKFNNCLPHRKTLSKWYSTINASPGLSVEALKMITIKVKSSERQIVCALIMDEIAIRHKIEFDGKKYYGYVDFGVTLDQDRDIAREALVFMIVAINDTWKCPVGYFFINGLNGTQKMNLVTQCLKALFDCECYKFNF